MGVPVISKTTPSCRRSIDDIDHWNFGGLINVFMVILTYILEFVWLMKHETRKTVTYERIDLIKPENAAEMKKDLEVRTGLSLNRFEIGKIDFLNDTAQVRVYYYAEEQEFSDYHVQ